MNESPIPGSGGAGAPAPGEPAPVAPVAPAQGRPASAPAAPADRSVGPFIALLTLLLFMVAQLVVGVVCVLALGRLGLLPRAKAAAEVGVMAVCVPLSVPLALAFFALACRLAGGAGLRRQCGLYWPRRQTALWWTAGMLALLVAHNFVGALFDLPDLTEWQLQSFRAARGIMPLFVVSLVLAAPCWEELLFRGFLYTSWTAAWHGRHCPPPPGAAPQPPLSWPAVVTGAIIPAGMWALLHGVQYEWPYLVMILAIGFYLAACRRYTNSLWLCMFLHALNNAVACALTWLSL